MLNPFDIFTIKEGDNEWLASTQTLTEAVGRMCDKGPGLYAMFCQEDQTTRNYFIDADGIISDITQNV